MAGLGHSGGSPRLLAASRSWQCYVCMWFGVFGGEKCVGQALVLWGAGLNEMLQPRMFVFYFKK